MTNLKLSKRLFNEVYYPYLKDYSHKYEVYFGGSGSGKSVFIAQKLLIKALDRKRRILVIRKTQVSQKESCWKLLLDLLSKWQIYSLCKINKTDMTIELPNGSTFLLKGLDDPERIKSIVGITDCWCEECTELTIEDFEQLTLRVREKIEDLQFFCSFNPISKANWVYKRWFEEEPDKDTLLLKTTYKDNKFLPKDYIKTLEDKIKTNPTYYKIYALGEFCSLDKLVYNNWQIKDFNEQEVEGKLCVGLDFGYTNDPTAIVASIVNEDNKEIYIFKEYYETGKTNDQIANIIKQLGFSKSDIIADSAEPKSIDEIYKLGIYRIKPSVKGPDSIRNGISTIQEYKIYVKPNLTNIITEFENYSYKKDKSTGEYLNEPIDQFNHLMDSLRYSMQVVTKTNKLKTIPKAVLRL